jgi:hypothetical protein
MEVGYVDDSCGESVAEGPDPSESRNRQAVVVSRLGALG